MADALAIVGTIAAAPARALLVELERACGRILAEPAVSNWALPRFSNSAVDGWAVRTADLDPDGATDLPVVGRVAAGQDASSISAAGGAVRIFTGAMLPADADAVVMQEHVRVSDDRVVVPARVIPGRNIRGAGENGAAGTEVLPSGRRLRPQDLALATAAGLTHLAVRDRLRVALLSTGDEVRSGGDDLESATVPDQNGPMLAALLDRPDVTVSRLGILGDDRTRLAALLLETAQSHDLIVTSGGVSVGEEDHVGAALQAIGRLLFWRVAMKPGRPVALGLVGPVPVLALPGNPVAAFTAFAILGQPLVDRLLGQQGASAATFEVTAAFTHSSPPGLRDYLPVTLDRTGSTVQARFPGKSGSGGGLALLVATVGLVEIAEDRTTIVPGDKLPFRYFP